MTMGDYENYPPPCSHEGIVTIVRYGPNPRTMELCKTCGRTVGASVLDKPAPPSDHPDYRHEWGAE